VNELPHLPGGDIDRLPFIFILHVGEHPSRLIGVSVTRYNHDSKLMAEAQLAVFRKCGPAPLGVGPGLFGIAEPWGPILNSRRMVLDRYYMESRYPNKYIAGCQGTKRCLVSPPSWLIFLPGKAHFTASRMSLLLKGNHCQASY